ncbi:M56 family metallopeptidase [Undibacterium macrobrachii]|jgi:beta-lactamase regulating signal transducer with metallopeptidase domain|uniref:Peptidase M56 domain-containing protein n=1 Tax=Undibacterium macrobrachii TaxID=1119058 RepID=A0ABQ2XFV7_9BURK|nr:M56 family metallopeptidase [Undibacterium macrobrachii]GGX14919.1 hypothetical protein GCM10011282_21570 [Undibacterium macrobrachii]
MLEQAAAYFLVYLITYLIHSSLLLGFAYVVQRVGLLNPITHTRFSESLWRLAYFAGFITAALHLVLASNMFQTNTSAASMHDSELIVPVSVLTTEGNAVDSVAVESTNPPKYSQNVAKSVPSSIVDFSLPSSISLPSYLSEIAIYIVSAWLIFAVFVVWHLVWQLRNLNRLALEEQADDACAIAASHQFIAEHFSPHQLRLQLRISPNWYSPMVVPNGVICLPQWMTEELTPAQQRAVLAHEIAHVVRKDTVWSIAYVLVLRLFFFQILNRMAYKRLRDIAELACDADASKTVKAQDLAKALYVCAKQVKDHTMNGLILAAHHEGSALEQRVRCLLEQRASLGNKTQQSHYLTKVTSATKLIVSGVGILGVTWTATFAMPTMQLPVEVSKSNVATDSRPNLNLEPAPESISSTVQVTSTPSGQAEVSNRSEQIASTPTAQVSAQAPLRSQNPTSFVVRREERTQLASQDLMLDTSWMQAELAYAQQDYQKAAQLYEALRASGRAEAQNRLNQIHARLQKQAEIQAYLTEFPANEYRLSAERCQPPANLVASGVRSKNLETLKQINDWEICYNQFVEKLQQRFAQNPIVPQELAILMTDAEIARANQIAKQTYHRISAEALAQLKPIQAAITQWQTERVQAEQLAQASSQQSRRAGAMPTRIQNQKELQSFTYANGRPLSIDQESNRVNDAFGWQHRGQTHAVDQVVTTKSPEK